MNFVDLAGAEFLAELARSRRKMGGALYFYRMKDSVAETLRKGGFMRDIGEENLFPAKSRPAEVIYPRLDSAICRTCEARLFAPCHKVLPNGEPVRQMPAAGVIGSRPAGGGVRVEPEPA
jgi:sulfate permease, SulP family